MSSALRHPMLAVALCAAAGWAAFPAGAQAAPRTHPRITLAQARTIALKTFPGHIVKAELEHERGGSGLRYSFDMRRGREGREVGVDAMTGRVLESSPQSPNTRD
jgi:uncharacterized membrane protein YkoI